jgi:tyrosyl-tRNA synthetase
MTVMFNNRRVVITLSKYRYAKNRIANEISVKSTREAKEIAKQSLKNLDIQELVYDMISSMDSFYQESEELRDLFSEIEEKISSVEVRIDELNKLGKELDSLV